MKISSKKVGKPEKKVGKPVKENVEVIKLIERSGFMKCKLGHPPPSHTGTALCMRKQKKFILC